MKAALEERGIRATIVVSNDADVAAAESPRRTVILTSWSGCGRSVTGIGFGRYPIAEGVWRGRSHGGDA